MSAASSCRFTCFRVASSYPKDQWLHSCRSCVVHRFVLCVKCPKLVHAETSAHSEFQGLLGCNMYWFLADYPPVHTGTGPDNIWDARGMRAPAAKVTTNPYSDACTAAGATSGGGSSSSAVLEKAGAGLIAHCSCDKTGQQFLFQGLLKCSNLFLMDFSCPSSRSLTCFRAVSSYHSDQCLHSC